MKILLSLLLVTISCTKYALNPDFLEPTKIDLLSDPFLISSQGEPNESMFRLVKSFSYVDEAEVLDAKTILELTQKNWLRLPMTERWEMKDIDFRSKQKISGMLGFFNMRQAVEPAARLYDYGVVFGAYSQTMEERFRFLVQKWKENVRFKEIIVLVGERYLDPMDKLPDHPDAALCKTETDAARLIYRLMDLPEDLKKIPVFFVDTEGTRHPDGRFLRPTTETTVVKWMNEKKPEPGSVLAFSNNPYIGYQNAVLRSLLPKDFSIETVGPAEKGEEKIAVYLDNLARWYYVSYKFFLPRS